MKKLFYFLAIAATASLSSCSSDDNNNSSEPVTPVLPDTSVPANPIVTVAVSAQSVNVGSNITFTAKDGSNTDVTSASTFYVNGTQISGNTYMPVTAAGTYTVTAKNQALTSAQVPFTVTDVYTGTQNSFTAAGTEHPTSESLLVYLGSENNVNQWAMLVMDMVNDEPQQQAGILFTTVQPAGQEELNFPTAGYFNFGQNPGTIEGFFAFNDDEIELIDNIKGLNLNIAEVNITEASQSWKINYSALFNDNNMFINGGYDGILGVADGSQGRMNKIAPLKVTKANRLQIKQNIVNLLKK